MNYLPVHLKIVVGKLIFAACSLLLLSSCGGGGSDSALLITPPTTEPSDVQPVTALPIPQQRGVAQKGPFALDSQVQLSELDLIGNPTGKTRQTTVSTQAGGFFYDALDEWSFIHINVEGSFYDESDDSDNAETLTQPISLSAISTDSEHTSVNLLTYWIAERSKRLLEDNLSLPEALQQAEQELNQLLGINNPNELDITQANQLTTDNASLLLVSGALMDVARQHQLNASVLIEAIATDFAEDGSLNEQGKSWLVRMQAVIRDNPVAHVNRYAKGLNQLAGVNTPQGDDLPTLINLASRPVAVVPGEIFGTSGTSIILDGSASHDGGGAQLVNFTWFRVDRQTGISASISNRFIASPSLLLPNEDAELLFALIVTDADGLIDISVVKVIVKGDLNNSPPLAESQVLTTDEDTPLSILLSGTDEDDDELSFSLTTPLLLPNGLLDGTPPNLTYTPTQDFNGTERFTYTVSDGIDSSLPASIEITVNPVNDRPVANAGSDEFIPFSFIAEVEDINDEDFFLNGSGSDVDGNVVLFAWTQTSGETILISNPGIANPLLTPSPGLTALFDLIEESIPPSTPVDTLFVFELVVTDNEGAQSVADSITIDLNLPPVAIGIDQDVASGATVTLDGSRSFDTNAAGSITGYAWSSNDGISLSNPNSATPTFTAPIVETGAQTLTFELIVTDNNSLASLVEMVTVTVTPEELDGDNTPPIANAGSFADQNTFDISNLGSDPDGDPITFQLQGVDSSPGEDAGVEFDFSAFPVVTAKPVDASALATGGFEFTVTDSFGAVSAPASVQVSFAPDAAGNEPPVANAGPDRTINVVTDAGDNIMLEGSGTDTDGSIASFAWTQTSGTTIPLSDPGIATPSLVEPPDLPPLDSALVVTYELVVTDNDGAESVADSVTLTLFDEGELFVANAGADQVVTSGDTVTLNGAGTDPSGVTVAGGFIWTALAGIALSDTSVAAPTFTAPDTTTTLDLTFQLVITDIGGNVVSPPDSVTIRVNPTAPAINLPPVANAGPDQTVIANGVTVFLDGASSSDPDGSIASYAWTAPPGTTLSDPGIANPTFSTPFDIVTLEILTFQLIVTDNDGATSPADSVIITVENPPAIAPVADAGPDQAVTLGDTVSLNGSNSTDADGTIVDFAWTAPGGIVLSDANIANPTYTPITGGAQVFSLTVTDDAGLTATDSVTISVNTPPKADAGPDQTVTTGTTTAFLDGSASSDPEDGPVASFAWSSPLGIALSDPTSATPTFTLPSTGTVFVFDLVVTDSAGAVSVTDKVTITVF